MRRTHWVVVLAFGVATLPCGCERGEGPAGSSVVLDIKPFFGQSREEVLQTLGEFSFDFGYELIWERDRTPTPFTRLVLEFREKGEASPCWYVHGTIETAEDLESVPELLGLGALERGWTVISSRANIRGAVRTAFLKGKIGPYDVDIAVPDAPGVSKRYKNFHVKLR